MKKKKEDKIRDNSDNTLNTSSKTISGEFTSVLTVMTSLYKKTGYLK